MSFSSFLPLRFLIYFLSFVFQLKSLETTLSGAFRREQMAENSIQQLEAEIEQLNRLVTFFYEYMCF